MKESHLEGNNAYVGKTRISARQNAKGECLPRRNDLVDCGDELTQGTIITEHYCANMNFGISNAIYLCILINMKIKDTVFTVSEFSDLHP